MEILGYEIKKKERIPGVIYMSDVNRDIDRKLRREKLEAKAKEVWSKAMEHKAELVALISGCMYGAGKLAKFIDDQKDAHKRSCGFYDYHLHRWCESKRKLTKKEDLEYKDRLSRGESPYEILKDMGLLKR